MTQARRILALAGLALALAGGLAWLGTGPESKAVQRAADDPRAPVARDTAAEPPESAEEPKPRPVERTPLGTTPAGEPAGSDRDTSGSGPRAALRGIVLDLHGRGVGRLAVGYADGGPPSARTALDGTFELEPPRPGEIHARDADFVTLAAGLWPNPVLAARVELDPDTPDVTLLVARRVPLAGRVVDERGAPLEGARLTIAVGEGQLADGGAAIRLSRRVLRATTSDADGGFRFDAAAGGMQLSVRAEARRRVELPVPDQGDAELEIVLRPALSEDELAEGRVVDGAGSPVADARVSAGWTAARTDGDGRFALPRALPPGVPAEAGERTVLALKEGFLPARSAFPSPRAGGEWVLVLEGRPRTLGGVVVDGDGRGLAGVRVALVDPTPFGLVETEPDTLRPVAAEAFLAGTGESAVWSDAQGRFVLAGLLDREYRLEALDERTLLAARTEALAAGSEGIRIVLHGRLEELAGRVVDSQGRGVGGVRVALARVSDPAAGAAFPEILEGPSASSASDGTFRFTAVAREGLVWNLHGADITPRVLVPVEPGNAPQVLQVERRCDVRLVRSSPGEDLRLRFVDARGAPLPVFQMEGGGFGQSADFLFRGQVTRAALCVPETAVEALVSTRAGPIRREPLSLAPGRPFELRLD